MTTSRRRLAAVCCGLSPYGSPASPRWRLSPGCCGSGSRLDDQGETGLLVGNEGTYGEQIGLTRDWAVRIIREVGNYGESFERNVGAGSRLGIPRGLNHLWSEGGIQYAPPIR